MLPLRPCLSAAPPLPPIPPVQRHAALRPRCVPVLFPHRRLRRRTFEPITSAARLPACRCARAPASCASSLRSLVRLPRCRYPLPFSCLSITLLALLCFLCPRWLTHLSAAPLAPSPCPCAGAGASGSGRPEAQAWWRCLRLGPRRRGLPTPDRATSCGALSRCPCGHACAAIERGRLAPTGLPQPGAPCVCPWAPGPSCCALAFMPACSLVYRLVPVLFPHARRFLPWPPVPPAFALAPQPARAAVSFVLPSGPHAFRLLTLRVTLTLSVPPLPSPWLLLCSDDFSP